jgi:hypothetical protein
VLCRTCTFCITRHEQSRTVTRPRSTASPPLQKANKPRTRSHLYTVAAKRRARAKPATMGLSKSTRIMILLAIDTAFFFLELVVGYAVHSLALVADSFHMVCYYVGRMFKMIADRSSSTT